MKKQVLFVLGLVFVFSGFVFAQAKTVTNVDLIRFKKARLKAEKELRENYKELGFSSPEELERQNAKSRKERAELSNRLRAERLERERIRAETASQNSSGVQYVDEPQFTDYSGYYGTTYYYQNSSRNRFFRNNRRFRNNRLRRNNSGLRFRFKGRIGTKSRNRKNNRFGPSRRLTRQNKRKSRRSNIRGFGFGISTGGNRN